MVIEAGTTVEADVMKEIANRRSLRAYASREVSAKDIRSLFEAARWAPSSMNAQPWKYVYGVKGRDAMWDKLHSFLNESNRIWAGEAPVLILSMTRRNFPRYGTPNPTAMYDLGAANAFLSLQATQLGLNVHQMGGYNREMTREQLAITEEFELGVIMAVGYPGEASQLPPALAEREQQPRTRFPQATFVSNMEG